MKEQGSGAVFRTLVSIVNSWVCFGQRSRTVVAGFS